MGYVVAGFAQLLRRFAQCARHRAIAADRTFSVLYGYIYEEGEVMKGPSRSKRRFGVSMLLVGALVATSCGGDDDDATSSATAVDTSATGETGDAPSADGGVLTFGNHSSLTNLDPDLATVGNDNEWLFPAYDRLVHLTPNGDFIPGLAESWELSEDGLTLTFHLRDGVVFHDGSSFTSDVAVTNLERSINLEGSINASALSAIASVEAVDDLTVQFNLTEPAASLIGILSDKPGIMISGQALADGVDLSSEAVGAGMFTLDSYRAGDRGNFVKFQDYWDPDSVLLDELVMVELTDNAARVNALRDGQIDAARIYPDGVAAAEGDGIVVESGPTLEVWYIPFRLVEGEPWTDDRVREALTYALDKQGILDVVSGGSGTVVSQMFPPNYFAASPNTEDDARPYDPDRARELLAEAGYPDGFSLRVGDPGYPVFAQAVQASWAEVGVDLEIIPQESSELVDNWFDGSFDMFAGPWSGRPDPNVTNDFLYSADSTFMNYVGYDVPGINELLAESEAASGEERTELLWELAAEANRVAFNIPVFAPDYMLAYEDDVQGLDIYTTVKQEFRGVSVG